MSARITSADLELLTTGQRRAVGGRTAQRAGAGFEKALDLLHAAYEAQGRAAMMRMPVPTAPAGMSRGRPVRVVTGKSGVDYWGVVRVAERVIPLVVECKASTKPLASLPLCKDDKGAGLKLSQLVFLGGRWRRFGVVPLVLWSNGGETGWLGPVQIAMIEKMLPSRIGRSWFTWFDGIDWLSEIMPELAAGFRVEEAATAPKQAKE